MEITFDRASKKYEPEQTVQGQIVFKDYKLSDIVDGAAGIKIKAESYLDTVSQIRGKMGRPALDEALRIYFMKKDVKHTDFPKAGPNGGRQYEFVLEATEKGEKLIDSYVGVEFSIIVSTPINFLIRFHSKFNVLRHI